jgi:D-glycero-D-manno-heptose 1,7-bisphosphate phosphatase
MKTSIKLIMLDRDGVINEDSADYIKSVEEFHPLPGSLEAIAALSKAGFKLAVVSNQSGLARGYFSQKTLEAMHDFLCESVKKHGGILDAIFYCPHLPEDHCDCRKPKTALLEKAARHFQVKPSETIFIGDSWKDMQAAMAFHSLPILVKTGNGETVTKNYDLTHITVCDTLSQAAQWILSEVTP